MDMINLVNLTTMKNLVNGLVSVSKVCHRTTKVLNLPAQLV